VPRIEIHIWIGSFRICDNTKPFLRLSLLGFRIFTGLCSRDPIDPIISWRQYVRYFIRNHCF